VRLPQLAFDVALVVYCIPEVHLGGLSHAAVVWLRSRTRAGSLAGRAAAGRAGGGDAELLKAVRRVNQ
jgi:hypothetical protein